MPPTPPFPLATPCVPSPSPATPCSPPPAPPNPIATPCALPPPLPLPPPPPPGNTDSGRWHTGTESAGKLGKFLVQAQFQGSVHTSALFLTAAAQNLLCLKLATEMGVVISSPWVTWLKGAFAPALLGLLVTPFIMYKVSPISQMRSPLRLLGSALRLCLCVCACVCVCVCECVCNACMCVRVCVWLCLSNQLLLWYYVAVTVCSLLKVVVVVIECPNHLPWLKDRSPPPPFPLRSSSHNHG